MFRGLWLWLFGGGYVEGGIACGTPGVTPVVTGTAGVTATVTGTAGVKEC